jgi:fatty acid desaturase
MAISSTESPVACSAPKSFSFKQARTLIMDLNRPNPWIYWTDFLVSITVGHLAFATIVMLVSSGPGNAWAYAGMAAAYVVTVLAYMRALMFIHELIHLPKDGFKAFRFAWNALAGVLFMVPSFLYYPHVDHHRRKHYGTEHDGEYLALSHTGRWMILGFVAQSLVIPLLGFARFFIISPICWVVPGARRYVHRHASTMLVDPSYERTDASPALMRTVVIQEVACFLWCVIFLTNGYVQTGQWFNWLWPVAYVVALGLLVLNEIRTLGAHRWTNEEGEMTFEQQLLDSVNYPDKPWISELWGPIGTRYHAVHHLFPSLPYHHLGKAHRRLSEGLPADSLYHQTSAKSLSSEITALWQRARESERRPALGIDVAKS